MLHFACCGLVGNPHLTSEQNILLLPFQRQPREAHMALEGKGGAGQRRELAGFEAFEASAYDTPGAAAARVLLVR